MYRNIQHLISAPLILMGAVRLRQAIPVTGVEHISPFILLHHFDIMMAPGEGQFDVPPHPHRGFMPITFMVEGEIAHEDSLGNAKVIGSNEVQWINAARGIIHSEKVSKEFQEKGGRFHGIQLWINLPAKQKMLPPQYQPITHDEIVLIERGGVAFHLVSGEFEGKKGPANSPILTAMIRMESGSTFRCNLPDQENGFIYLLEGELIINGANAISQHTLVSFKREPGEIFLEATRPSSILLCSGPPIDEPMVTHGPFVMNSQAEILEAMRDYQSGKMGFLY